MTGTGMTNEQLITWLLEGDVSVAYQARRDLLDDERPDLRARIATEGWGARFLAARQPNGHWGRGFYQPKWISTHYTLLDLALLGCEAVPAIEETVARLLAEEKSDDGGLNPARSIAQSDVCVNGMALTYLCRFGAEARELESIVDFLLREHMADGGFNCRSNRSGARHSSVHSTISVLEGIQTYAEHGYVYRLDELQAAAAVGREFLYVHRLFRSDRSGEVIHPSFLKLSYPSRWKYDVLRALDYLRRVDGLGDPRVGDALDVLAKKRRKDGRWTVQAKHAGQVHFDMEKAGKPSRWNTLRALRVVRSVRV